MPVQAILSKFKEVFTYDESPREVFLHRFAMTIEADDSGKALPTGPVCGAADLILRMEDIAHHVPGGRAHVVALGSAGVPITCDSGRATLKLEACARQEEDINYLIEHIFEEMRGICARRHLAITVDHMCETQEESVAQDEALRQAAKVAGEVFGHRAGADERSPEASGQEGLKRAEKVVRQVFGHRAGD